MDYNQKSVHPLWGPLLDDYLRESPLGENFITQATPDEISITLRIFKTGRPSWMDFELLLSLPNRPGQLWHFLDAELVPGCMRLLREHCKSNRIFSHAYGLLCIRTLCLILEVSLLDCVDRVIFQLADGLGRHKKLAELLGMTIEQLMEDNSIRWLGRQHLKDLDWYNVPERLNSFSCLPKSGGLRYPDVEFLMRVLCDDAGAFQRVCRDSNILGFSTLLFLFWQHTLLISAKERPAVIILNLITRYWPHAQEDENSILNFMLDWGFLCLGDSAEAKILSKDQPDMKILVETYVTLMTNPSTSSKFLIINDAVRFVELLKVGPIVMIPQLVGKLIVSVLDRVWMELNAPNRKAKDTESIIQLGGAVLTLTIPLRKASQDVISALLMALLPPLSNEHGIDYINLIGRLVVLGLHSALRSTHLMPLQAFLFKSNMLLDFLDEVSAPMVETFSHGRHDWQKVDRWIDFQWDLYGNRNDSKSQAVTRNCAGILAALEDGRLYLVAGASQPLTVVSDAKSSEDCLVQHAGGTNDGNRDWNMGEESHQSWCQFV